MTFRQTGPLVLLAAFFCACATVQGPAYQPTGAPHAKSAVYLYRPADSVPDLTLINIDRPSGIIDCGNFSVALKNGGYRRFLVDPGLVRCTVSSETNSSVTFTAGAGHDYYVRESTHSGLLGPRINLDFVSPQDANAEISQCHNQQ